MNTIRGMRRIYKVITVFLEDGNPIFVKGLAEKLKKGMNLEVIPAWEQGITTLDSVTRRQPDLFIYDIDANGERTADHISHSFISAARVICFGSLPRKKSKLRSKQFPTATCSLVIVSWDEINHIHIDDRTR